MSDQKERSLDDLLSEVRQLKERIKAILPSHTALLKELSRLPDELEGRFWASRVEVLLEKVRADYQTYQAHAQKADLWGKFMTVGVDIILKAGGMEPVPLPDPLRVGVSISPSGKIVPSIIDEPNRQPDAVLVTHEEFLAIAQRLKEELLKGTIVPSSEDEIPKILYKNYADRQSQT